MRGNELKQQVAFLRDPDAMPSKAFQNGSGFLLINFYWSVVALLCCVSFCCTSNISASQVALVVKNPPANAGDIRDVGSIPESGRSPSGGHGNPPPYSCLQNPMDRGAWWATVHQVTRNRTWLKWLSMHVYVSPLFWISFLFRSPLALGRVPWAI